MKLSGNLYRGEDGKLELAVKGAPETIINRSRLTAAEREKIELKLNELAGKGYKVVAIASGQILVGDIA